MKRFKKIAIVILVSILLLIGTAIILLMVYEKDIKTGISENVKSSLGLDLKIDDIRFSVFSNWPHASIELKKVQLNSLLSFGPNEPFLNAESIYLSFNLRKLFQKELNVNSISIKNAQLTLRKKKDGSTNFQFKTPEKDKSEKTSKVKFEIKKILLKNTGFTFVNEAKTQRLNFNFVKTIVVMKESNEGIEANLTGQLHIGGLIFKSKSGAFFKNANLDIDLYAGYQKNKKTICVYPPSVVKIENLYYTTTCLIDLSEKQQAVIMVKTQSTNVFKASKLLNPKMQKVLSGFHVVKPIQADALIGIAIGKRQDPILIIHLETKNNLITIGESKVPYSDVNFKGRIISITKDKKSGNDDQAIISFDTIQGKLYAFPFTASVTVNSLTSPQLSLTANLLIESEKIEFPIAKRFKFHGSCLARLNYSGSAKKLNRQEFLDHDMKLSAFLIFKNVSFQSNKNNFLFVLNGNAQLNGQVLTFQKMVFGSNGGNALISGKADNFTNYILGTSNYLKAKLDVKVNEFNLNPYFTTVNYSIPRPKKPIPNAPSRNKNKFNPENELLDLHLNVAINKMSLRKVEAQHANITADYIEDNLYLRNISMDVCEGHLNASAFIKNFESIHAQMNISSVNVVKVFEQMDNFGQESIQSENLKGSLDLTAAFDADLDEAKNVIPASMVGEVKLKLKDGHLINFEPMQNISNYIFKNRDFKDIYFSEINENFKLRSHGLKIEEMELASNVINMYVSGFYSFKENSVINILIPWNNLKRREKDHVPKASGGTAEDAKGIKLNFSGPPKKMKLSMGNKAENF